MDANLLTYIDIYDRQVSIKSAKGMLVNITGGPDMTLHEVDQAAQRVTEEVREARVWLTGRTWIRTLCYFLI